MRLGVILPATTADGSPFGGGEHARACYALLEYKHTVSERDGHSRVRGNPGRPPALARHTPG
jgi:hypothetical protein